MWRSLGAAADVVMPDRPFGRYRQPSLLPPAGRLPDRRPWGQAGHPAFCSQEKVAEGRMHVGANTHDLVPPKLIDPPPPLRGNPLSRGEGMARLTLRRRGDRYPPSAC